MKKITFFFLLLTVSFGYSQVVLEDFEGPTPAVFSGFEGLASATQVADPAVGGANGQVLELVSAAAGQPWQGAELVMQSNMLDLSTDITVQVDVYSTQAFDLFAKVEDKVQDPATAASATATAYTNVGTWQTLTFTFNQSLDGTGNAAGQYSQIAFFPNWNIAGNTWNNPAGDFTIYVDNIRAVEGLSLPLETCSDGLMNQDETGIDCGGTNCAPCAGGPAVLEDFEGPTPAVFSGFEGLASATQVADPAVGGTNGQVLEIVSAAAGQPWQGAELVMQSNMLDLSTDITVQVDVYSTQAFDLFAKVEDKIQDPVTAASATATAYTNVGTWQTLTFTFNQSLDGTGNAAGQYSQIAFFPNWNIAGNTWNNPAGDFALYVDNIRAVEGLSLPLETCSDGIMNQDETGIDCGGSTCAPCDTTLVILEDLEGTPPAVFSGFEGLASATQVADPAVGGTNGQVLEIVSAAAGQPWQGAELVMQSNMLDLSTVITVEVDVYSTQAFDLFAKVEDKVQDPATAASATATSYTTVGAWQTLTFTFDQSLDGTGNAAGEYSQIAFFPNWNIAGNTWNNPAADFTLYVDNVRAVAGAAIVGAVETCDDGILNNGETEIDCGGPNCDSCLVLPTTAPPTPPARAAADVISIYGEAYGTAAGLNNVPWDDPSNFVEENIASNNVLKVDFDGFMGSDLGAIVDASNMTHFHMDYWVADEYADGQVFNAKWSNHAGGTGETDAGELTIAFAGSSDVQNWVSIDVPLSDFNNVFGGGIDNRAELTQFLITVGGLTKRAYLDNIYFHKDSTLSTDDLNAAEFKVYPNPTTTNWTISGNTTITKVTVYDILGKQVSMLTSNQNEVEISTINMSAGMYFAKIESNNGFKTVKLIKE